MSLSLMAVAGAAIAGQAAAALAAGWPVVPGEERVG